MDQEATPLESGTRPCLRFSPESETKQDPHLETDGDCHTAQTQSGQTDPLREGQKLGPRCVEGSRELGGGGKCTRFTEGEGGVKDQSTSIQKDLGRVLG